MRDAISDGRRARAANRAYGPLIRLRPNDRRAIPLFAQFGDDPERLLAAGDALDVVERVAERLLPVLPTRPARCGARMMLCRVKSLCSGAGGSSTITSSPA